MQREDFIKSLAFVYSVGKPLWFLTFCINYTIKIKKNFKNEVWRRKK